MSSNARLVIDDGTPGPTNTGRAPVGFDYIDFFGTEDGAEVKIGRTKKRPDLRRVLHEHDSGRDTQMRTLAVVLGHSSDEGQLKRFFAPYCSRPRSKEWIAAGEIMRDYLRWLRSQPYVATSDSGLDVLHPVDAQEWLPNGARAKAPTQLKLAADGDPWEDLNLDLVTEGDYYTHSTIIEAAREAMGSIDLDPASCREANEVVCAPTFYGFRENGLLQDWRGNVWLNPPFGNWAEWVPKTLAEWQSGRLPAMCVLSESRVTTAKMFHPLVREASALVVMCGRFAFWGPNASMPDEGHVVFYFGPDVQRFSRAFHFIGTTFKGLA